MSIGPHPNAHVLVDEKGNESPWEEYFDLTYNHSYWYNRVTNEVGY